MGNTVATLPTEEKYIQHVQSGRNFQQFIFLKSKQFGQANPSLPHDDDKNEGDGNSFPDLLDQAVQNKQYSDEGTRIVRDSNKN